MVPIAETGVGAHDQVALVVTGYQPALDLLGPLVDRDRVHDLAPRLDPAAAQALGPAGAQVRLQLAFQLTAGVDVQALVDALVADPHPCIVRELDPQPTGHLLGGVPAFEHGLNPRPQARVARQLRRFGSALTLPRQPVGHLGHVPARARIPVARQLTTDRRRAALHQRRDLTQRPTPGLDQPSQLVPLLPAQVPPRIRRPHRSEHPTEAGPQVIHERLRHARGPGDVHRTQPLHQQVQHPPHHHAIQPTTTHNTLHTRQGVATIP